MQNVVFEKKIDLQRDFAAGVYLAGAHNPIPPLHIVYVYTVYRTYIHTGNGGRGLNQREGDRATIHKAVENTNMTDCISSQ
jgi:hypothetical protein